MTQRQHFEFRVKRQAVYGRFYVEGQRVYRTLGTFDEFALDTAGVEKAIGIRARANQKQEMDDR